MLGRSRLADADREGKGEDGSLCSGWLTGWPLRIQTR
jgi:hypothetical protein